MRTTSVVYTAQIDPTVSAPQQQSSPLFDISLSPNTLPVWQMFIFLCKSLVLLLVSLEKKRFDLAQDPLI